MQKVLTLAVILALGAGTILDAQEKNDAAKNDAAKKDAAPAPSKDAAKSKAPADDKLTMTVITKTGKVNKFARADAIKIYVLFNGDVAHKVRIYTPKKNNFELGATDTFKNLPVDIPLDEIKTLTLAVEGDDMWKCEFISFQFFQKGLQSREYKFNPDRFLSGGKEKKKLNATTHLDFKLTTKPVLAPPEPADKDKAEKPAAKKEPKASEKK